LAMHTLALLTARNGERMPTGRIAEALGASEAHLAKVMSRLTRAGLVSAVRGPGGGFVLAKPPERIALIDIYEAIEGEMPAGGCLLGKAACPGGRCVLGGLVRSVNEQVKEHLQRTKLTDLAVAFEEG